MLKSQFENIANNNLKKKAHFQQRKITHLSDNAHITILEFTARYTQLHFQMYDLFSYISRKCKKKKLFIIYAPVF